MEDIMKYIQNIKEKYQDAVVFFRNGDFYTMLGKDAFIARSALSLPVNQLTIICGKSFVSASFQISDLDTYLPKLVRAGFRIAICDLPNISTNKTQPTKTTIKKDEVNAAMLIVAKQLAEKNGYIDLGCNIIDAKRSWFWANRFIAETSNEPVRICSCKYILPVWEDEIENKRRPKIEIDMFWGLPRLIIDLPDGTMACITYKDGICSDVQAFGENGIALATSLKEEIDYYLKIF